MLKDQRETSANLGESCETTVIQAVPAQPDPPVACKGCTVPGCTGRFLARGYCVRHYYQVKRHGVVQAAGQRFARAFSPRSLSDRGEDWRQNLSAPRLAAFRREAHCQDGECPEKPFSRGLCRLHYIVARSQDLIA